MPGPKSFVVKKTTPGMSSTKISDRNTQLEVQNIIENIRDLHNKIVALQEGVSAATAQLADLGTSTPVAVTSAELYDSPNVPGAPPLPYLRFERDEDGDVQTIYLGTVN